MREIEFEGRVFAVKALKRSQMKALRKEGFILGKIESDQMDDWVDKIIEMACPGRMAEIDDLPPKAAHAIFDGILKESYGDPAESKN